MLIAKPERDINTFYYKNCYVNPYLRKILKKALKNFTSLTEKENETIQDFLRTNRFFYNTKFSDIVRTINNYSHKYFNIIDKPQKLILKIWVSPAKYADFWNHCNFDVLLDMQTPTATKIVNCLITDSYLTNDILH